MVYYELKYGANEFTKIGELQKTINLAEGNRNSSITTISYDIIKDCWKVKLKYVDMLVDIKIQKQIENHIELFGAC